MARAQRLFSIALLFGGALVAPLSAAPVKPAPATPAANGDVTRAEMMGQIRQVFTVADTDKDNFMSLGEFRVRMGAVLNRNPPGSPGAPDKARAQELLDAATAAFNAVDTNGDGKLSRPEAAQRPLAAFDAMDANHDGVLTVAEKQAARRAANGPAGPVLGGR